MLPFNDKNSQTAKAGFAHQKAFMRLADRWRSDPLAAALCREFFGPGACARALRIRAVPCPDASAKPDVLVLADMPEGQTLRCAASLKMISSQKIADMPTHHAGRVPFRQAREHFLFPSGDPELESALLEHFVDGESISRKSPALLARLEAFYSGENLLRLAQCALAGLGDDKADFIALTLCDAPDPQSVTILDARACPCAKAAAFAASKPFRASEPAGDRVGTIGNGFLHLQRGQALSAGPQNDIQIKLNAKALFDALAAPGPSA